MSGYRWSFASQEGQPPSVDQPQESHPTSQAEVTEGEKPMGAGQYMGNGDGRYLMS